ncbi:MAG: hypothetical protein GVY28_02635 [Alphaproteobacteria bacterium]|jgi:hypothetical protein|nr:hypothetical protein [Alphaproteobacteria bacterium]
MTRNLPALFCAIGAAAGAIVSVPTLVNPEGVIETVGFAFTTDFGRSEFVTFYGGLYFGLTVFYVVATLSPALRPGALAFLGFSSAGALVTRLATGIGTDGPWLALVIAEAVLAAIGFWGWRLTRRAPA